MVAVFSRVAAAVTAVLLVVAAHFAYMQVFNFHTAVDGELYRSDQLERGDIARYAKRYGIRTVINLRGDNTGSAWYDNEIAEARAAGVEHINFRMSAKRELSAAEAYRLIAVMKQSHKPVLIHCRSGSDRTGLAAALYVAGIKKGSEFASELQLSPLYGHLWFTQARAMNETFEKLEPALGFSDS